MVTSPASRHERLHLRPHARERSRRLRIEPEAEQSADDAHDVTVHHRGGNAEGDRGHRRARVGPDAGQLPPAFERAWKCAGRRDDPGRAVQIPRARVVPEAAPLGEDRALGRPGERLRRGEARKEPLPASRDDRDGRLLEHDLGNPDRVRISRPPPRQVALRSAIPACEAQRDGVSPEEVGIHGDTILARWSSTGRA